MLETGLQQSKYILGKQFTVADILIGNTLAWASTAGWPIQSETLTTYLERLLDRPALGRVRERETADAA